MSANADKQNGSMNTFKKILITKTKQRFRLFSEWVFKDQTNFDTDTMKGWKLKDFASPLKVNEQWC